jgi:hypothetical protein
MQADPPRLAEILARIDAEIAAKSFRPALHTQNHRDFAIPSRGWRSAVCSYFKQAALSSRKQSYSKTARL